MEKFKSIIKQMQNDMVEFFTELKQEYMGLENGGGSGENGEDMGGIGFV